MAHMETVKLLGSLSIFSGDRELLAILAEYFSELDIGKNLINVENTSIACSRY